MSNTKVTAPARVACPNSTPWCEGWKPLLSTAAEHECSGRYERVWSSGGFSVSAQRVGADSFDVFFDTDDNEPLRATREGLASRIAAHFTEAGAALAEWSARQ